MSAIQAPEPTVVVMPPIVEDDPLYEIVNGKHVPLPPVSALAGLMTSRILCRAGTFADANDLGHCVAEGLFQLESTLHRRPDVAFVSYERWPKNRPLPASESWSVIPNLAIEIVSPADLMEPLLKKVAEYLNAGVQLVWVVFPKHQMVYVYQSLTHIRILTATDEWDGSTLLPGFKLALSALFAGAADDTESSNGDAS